MFGLKGKEVVTGKEAVKYYEEICEIYFVVKMVKKIVGLTFFCKRICLKLLFSPLFCPLEVFLFTKKIIVTSKKLDLL